MDRNLARQAKPPGLPLVTSSAAHLALSIIDAEIAVGAIPAEGWEPRNVDGLRELLVAKFLAGWSPFLLRGALLCALDSYSYAYTTNPLLADRLTLAWVAAHASPIQTATATPSASMSQANQSGGGAAVTGASR